MKKFLSTLLDVVLEILDWMGEMAKKDEDKSYTRWFIHQHYLNDGWEDEDF